MPSINTRIRLQQKARAICIRYASDELRRDRKVVITAMLNHPGSLVYCLDEKLKAELSGLSKAQLTALLETADEDMKPQIENDEPLDDFHKCLLCFDMGGLCPNCAVAQDKTSSSSPSMLESKSDLLALEDSTKKSKKKKKKKKNNQGTKPISDDSTPVEASVSENTLQVSVSENTLQEDSVGGDETSQMMNNDNLFNDQLDFKDTVDDEFIWRRPIDECWSTNVLISRKETQQLSRSKTLNLALLRIGFDFDDINNSYKRFLILGADAREGNNVNETLDQFSETFLRLLTNNENVIVEFSLFGPNIPIFINGKSYEFCKYKSIDFAQGSKLKISYSNKLYHEVDPEIRALPFDLSICFNSGFWGYPDWLPTLKEVLAPGNSPLLLTAYSESELEDDIECLQNELSQVYSSVSTLWGPEVNPMRSLSERPSHATEMNFENHSWLCLMPPPEEEEEEEEVLLMAPSSNSSPTSFPSPIKCTPSVAAVLTKYGIRSDQHDALLADLALASMQDYET